MGKLSPTPYVGKCILGMEIFYVVCLLYGAILTGPAKETHDFLWSIGIPGFTYLTMGSAIWGAVYLGILAAIFGSYMVWMHNTSMESER